MSNRLSDLQVRIESHIAGMVIDQSGWQGATELAAPCLVEDTAAQPCLDHMQFGLTHCSLEAEQEAVVETCRIVDAVLVENEGVSKGADLQQTLPVGMAL
ncbi:hypothetical protein JOH51_007275 [Rhizobium leguminosarum]|nr:hypothetical protein [Rhizobium leguminosarum]